MAVAPLPHVFHCFPTTSESQRVLPRGALFAESVADALLAMAFGDLLPVPHREKSRM